MRQRPAQGDDGAVHPDRDRVAQWRLMDHFHKGTFIESQFDQAVGERPGGGGNARDTGSEAGGERIESLAGHLRARINITLPREAASTGRAGQPSTG